MSQTIYIDYIALRQDALQEVTDKKYKYITGVKEHCFGAKILQLLQLCGILYYSTEALTLVVQTLLSFYQRLQFQEVDKAEVERETSLVQRIQLECPDWKAGVIHVMTISQPITYDSSSSEAIIRKLKRFCHDIKERDTKYAAENREAYTLITSLDNVRGILEQLDIFVERVWE